MIQELLIDLCNDLEQALNYKEKTNKVFYRCESRPYFNNGEYREYDGRIYVNSAYIYKQVEIVTKEEIEQTNLSELDYQVKEKLARRMLCEVFMFGIMASKKEIDDRKIQFVTKNVETHSSMSMDIMSLLQKPMISNSYISLLKYVQERLTEDLDLVKRKIDIESKMKTSY